jgi:flagellar biosynthesis anti-sigma factor FlgM
MKIVHRGPADTEVPKLVHNDKSVVQKPAAGVKNDQNTESAKVNISREARELQKVAELARIGDELRADKVRQIKEKLAADEYHVDAKDVATSILRSEVTRLLNK